MSLKICVLGSGSAGNCVYVGTPGTHLLVDAGLSGTETERRLEQIGVAIRSIQAICVTHEHEDHRSGLGVLQRRRGIALYANAATADGVDRASSSGRLTWNIFLTGEPFQIGELRLEPFTVPHDSYDPVGFVISDGLSRVGVVTDMGMATSLIRQRLRDCEAIVVECNHDEDLLKQSSRPWSLKQRIMSRQGHLSNGQAAELIASIAGPRLKTVFLAHLSPECNRPLLAVRCVERALAGADCPHVQVKLTYPDRISELVVA